MKCPSCGVDNKSIKKFCRKCGATLVVSQTLPKAKFEESEELYKRVSGELRKIILSFATAVFLTLAGYTILRFFLPNF